jgi:hypothetical protein
MINGVTKNKVYDGRPQWVNKGLNDASRNQEFTRNRLLIILEASLNTRNKYSIHYL